MKISPRDRLIITIGIAAVIVIALVAVLIYPQFQQLGTLNSQVADATAQAESAKLLLQERQGFKDRAVQTDAEWLRLMNEVPDTPDLASLIIELQDLAFQHDVQVVSVTPAQPSLTGTFQTIPLSTEIIGSWQDTVDYLEDLMKLDRGIRLVNANVKVTSNDSSAAKRNAPISAYSVDTIISMKAYTIPSATATGTPAASTTP